MSAAAATKRILVVEDHAIFRHGLRHLLDGEPGLQVCGEARSVEDALAFVNESLPDLVVSDLTLPDRSGLELVKDLTALHPFLPVLFVSTQDELVFAERVLRAGGRGYLKMDACDALIEAVQQILTGGLFLSPRVMTHFVDRLAAETREEFSFPISRLSMREREVFQLLGQGKSTEQIGRLLGIGNRTVNAHRTRLRDKLGMADARELLRHAIRWVEAVQPD